MKIAVIAGARPNFMKVAPLIEALRAAGEKYAQLSFLLIHTGQHYDHTMSSAFFDDLGLPRPDVSLDIGSGTHSEQTGRAMIACERVFLEEKPDWVVVVGDVNSTVACALAAKKLGINVAHVEAGLRSHDRTMPEEINRVLTDVVSDALFTTELDANYNLRAEGIPAERIHFVGNVMIDTLLKHRERALTLAFYRRLGLRAKSYATLTLHRPSNVDRVESFSRILRALAHVARELPIAFPIHPRTRKSAESLGLWEDMRRIANLHLLKPLSYLEMLSLNASAAMILTDSGGLQEEAAALRVPCITLRENTERPITVKIGANTLVGNEPAAIVSAARAAMSRDCPLTPMPEKWDGHAATRIVDALLTPMAEKWDGQGATRIVEALI
jgi:UDP-N-acetylglucosamine 2-epimerase (non-hydrolysing)